MIALLLCTSPTLLWAELPKQPAPVVEVEYEQDGEAPQLAR